MSLGSFWNDLHYEDIHFRDDWQIELQSDFACNLFQKKSVYKQEFYIFIPASLQVNKQSYTKEQFYNDRTSLIRFKTPEFTLKEVVYSENPQSPIVRIEELMVVEDSDEAYEIAEKELKLLANIVRSSVRNTVREIIDMMLLPKEEITRTKLSKEIVDLCHDIKKFRKTFAELKDKCKKKWKQESIHIQFDYVDEFISRCIEYYLTGLLAYVRETSIEQGKDADSALCKIILEERKVRVKEHEEPEIPENEESHKLEALLYRKGLLNKFVLDELLLKLKRTHWAQKYGSLIGGIAAGIAMLVYVLLFSIKSSFFVINSLPFIILTVFVYILKDRIKESVKSLFHRQAFKWFSDYTTEIISPFSQKIIGKLKESFTFVEEPNIPQDILRARNKEFKSDLPLFKRHEEVIYYKKELIFERYPEMATSRRKKIHNIFLFNFNHILEKASNAYEASLYLENENKALREVLLPKVYHINIVVRNSTTKGESLKTEIKKFRVVIDKRGIRRVERVSRE